MVAVFSKGTQIREGLGWLQETSLRHRCRTHLSLPVQDPAVFYNEPSRSKRLWKGAEPLVPHTFPISPERSRDTLAAT